MARGAAVTLNKTFEASLAEFKGQVGKGDIDSAIEYGVQLVRGITSEEFKSKATGVVHKKRKKRLNRLYDICLQSPSPIGSAILLGISQRPDLRRLPLEHPGIIIHITRMALSHPDEYLPVLQRLIPIRGIHRKGILLPQIVPALVDQGIPTVLIHDLAMKELQRDPESVHLWPIGLWDTVIGSADQFDRVEKLLELAKRSRAMERLLDGSMTVDRALTISRPFSAAIYAWISMSERHTYVRNGSRVPQGIARQLCEIVGEKWLPTKFLNTWMNAERVAGNYHVADLIWRIFDIKPKGLAHMVQDAIGGDLWVSTRPRPDVTSWKGYFKLHKSLPVFKTLRHSVRAMMDTVPLEKQTTALLDSVLSTVTKSADIEDLDVPLMLFVLRLYEWEPKGTLGPQPSSRTIELASSGLIMMWRKHGPMLDPLFVASKARGTREMVAGRTSTTLHSAEWDLVSSTLQELISVNPDDTVPPIVRLPLDRRHVGPSSRNELDPVYHDMPSQLIRPMLVLVERAIRVSLSDKALNEEHLDEMYWKAVNKVYEDVKPRDGETWGVKSEAENCYVDVRDVRQPESLRR